MRFLNFYYSVNRKNLNHNKIFILTFLHLLKAFDMISHSFLIEKLYHKFKFSRSALNYMQFYLLNRKQFVAINNSSSGIVKVNSGFSHVAVLGSILFSLFLNDLTEQIETDGCTYFAWAEDMLILLSSG